MERIRRIRLPRDPAQRTLTAEQYQAEFLIAYAQPEFPSEAKAKNIEGTVTLGAVVGNDGIIQSLSVLSGDPLLAESALEAVRHWTYRPLTVNGIPVEVVTEIDVNFTCPQTA